MKKRTRRNAFTIVELVIVIAVVAILAAVLIPTYVGLVKKANLSNDKQNIRNMNTALAVSVIPDSQFKYAGNAITALYSEGWNMGKLETYSSGYQYAYSLENNKMYLIDDNNAVVYPEEVDKGTLWGLWKNSAVDMIAEVNKYISLVNIIDGYYANHFSIGSYIIDLNSHYIRCNDTLSNVTVVNGIFISGATKAEDQGIIEVDEGEVSTVVSGTPESITIIENKAFDLSGNENLLSKNNITFRNCFFYNANESGSKLGNRTFENCTFIDSNKYIFNLQGHGVYDGFLVVKGCTFINCNRVFNMPIGVYGQTTDGSITIDGNTFYASTEEKRSTCQLMTQKVNDSTEITSDNLHYLDIIFSNNTYVDCASTQAGLFTLYDDLQKDGANISNDHISFINNKVNSSIDSSKYIVNDDGKSNNEVPNYNEAFKLALIAKFNAGKVSY